jgi:hypothetical protein
MDVVLKSMMSIKFKKKNINSYSVSNVLQAQGCFTLRPKPITHKNLRAHEK